jgi:hypothetical protein
MHRTVVLFFSLPAVLAVLLLCNASGAWARTRVCTVQEAIPTDSYTYVLCQGSNDIWLAASLRNIAPGEQLSYSDAPPLANYCSKSLGRIFPGVIITDVWRAGESRPAAAPFVGAPAAPPYDSAASASGKEVFAGTDENGTLVFSDDPDKVRGRENSSSNSIRSTTKKRK